MTLPPRADWRKMASLWVKTGQVPPLPRRDKPDAFEASQSRLKSPRNEGERTMNSVRAARFEGFVKMRLAGDTDLIYRAYDLLTPDRTGMKIKHYIRMAGLELPKDGEHEVLTTLQARYKSWGYGIIELKQIEKLLHEFWVYHNIRYNRKKNWPYRDPDEARALYDEAERRKRARIKASSS